MRARIKLLIISILLLLPCNNQATVLETIKERLLSVGLTTFGVGAAGLVISGILASQLDTPEYVCPAGCQTTEYDNVCCASGTSRENFVFASVLHNSIYWKCIWAVAAFGSLTVVGTILVCIKIHENGIPH